MPELYLASGLVGLTIGVWVGLYLAKTTPVVVTAPAPVVVLAPAEPALVPNLAAVDGARYDEPPAPLNGRTLCVLMGDDGVEQSRMSVFVKTDDPPPFVYKPHGRAPWTFYRLAEQTPDQLTYQQVP